MPLVAQIWTSSQLLSNHVILIMPRMWVQHAAMQIVLFFWRSRGQPTMAFLWFHQSPTTTEADEPVARLEFAQMGLMINYSLGEWYL